MGRNVKNSRRAKDGLRRPWREDNAKTDSQIISELLRQTLNESNDASEETGSDGDVYGFRPFPSRGGVVTNTLIDELRGDFGD